MSEVSFWLNISYCLYIVLLKHGPDLKAAFSAMADPNGTTEERKNAMSKLTSKPERNTPAVVASWLALLATGAAILLLASLHVLSPEFSPSWRMISEYALGHYAWVLSLMFLSLGIGTMASAIALWPEVHTRSGKAGLWLLMLSGLGGAMASVFDITHPVGHGIAGLLGVIGFPIATLLLSSALAQNERWHKVQRPLFWIANLSWISVLLLIATLAIMSVQMARLNGGHLPQHAPKSLPAGVLALDGYADRLIVLSSCAWVLLAAWHRVRISAKRSELHDDAREQNPGELHRLGGML